jgi:hypothetical protein
MKHAVCIFVLAAFSGPTLATEPIWYLGSDISRTEFATTPNNTRTNGLGFTLGAKATENLAVELQARDLGSWTVTYVHGSESESLSEKHAFRSVSASVLGILPLSEGFSLHGRLGFARHTMKLRSISANTNKAFWGLGASYQIDKQLGLRLELQKLGAPVFTLEDSYQVGGKIKQFNAGLTYAF